MEKERDTDTGRSLDGVDVTLMALEGDDRLLQTMQDDIYPVMVFMTRYSGVYEGDRWAAICAWEIPEEAHGSDIECAEWWAQVGDKWAGVGPTPNSAVLELYKKIKKRYSEDPLSEHWPIPTFKMADAFRFDCESFRNETLNRMDERDYFDDH